MASSYLVIHKITFYNDEFYIDFTGESGFANPVELLSSRAEAELAVSRLTREAIRGGYWYDFKPDLETLSALETMSHNPSAYGVSRDAFNEKVFSTDLSDQQLDQFIAALGIRLFYVLEADLSEKAAHEAEIVLQQTHERPQCYEAYSDEGKPQAYYSGNAVAERLNRVTQLFGRRYATELPY